MKIIYFWYSMVFEEIQLKSMKKLMEVRNQYYRIQILHTLRKKIQKKLWNLLKALNFLIKNFLIPKISFKKGVTWDSVQNSTFTRYVTASLIGRIESIENARPLVAERAAVNRKPTQSFAFSLGASVLVNRERCAVVRQLWNFFDSITPFSRVKCFQKCFMETTALVKLRFHVDSGQHKPMCQLSPQVSLIGKSSRVE